MELNDWLIVACGIAGVFVGMSLQRWTAQVKRRKP